MYGLTIGLFSLGFNLLSSTGAPHLKTEIPTISGYAIMINGSKRSLNLAWLFSILFMIFLGF